jgi:predicted O-methyltransferase YrrM
MTQVPMSSADEKLQRVRAVRARHHAEGPARTRPIDDDFQRVALPSRDCDALRDLLVEHHVQSVIEIGLAYGSSALAIGEALCSAGDVDVSHKIIDPFQATSFHNVGWDVLTEAGLATHTSLIAEPSSVALARLASAGVVSDAAFVDGSHRFHEVFVDLYFLRKLVRPGGLIVLDDAEWPSVATALRYYDLNLGWTPMPIVGRLTARQLPLEPREPDFADFRPFQLEESS